MAATCPTADPAEPADPVEPADPAEPDDRADLAFRVEVARLRASERRRLFPLGVQVGEPAGRRRRLEVPWPVPAELDQGLRFDLADALLAEPPATRAAGDRGTADQAVWGWVERPGVPQLHDRDLEWFAAVTHAAAAHGLLLAGFRAVTRAGWLDVVSGVSQAWKQPRR